MGGTSKELTACAAATEVTADAKRIMIFPMGRHVGRDGRGPYELRDVAHALAVIQRTREIQGSTDIALDFDHQLARNVERGEEGSAIASGWVKPSKLVADEDGIWAEDPEWTPNARAKLTAREYRYLSPHFGFLKEGGAVTRIINAALVNRPNLEIAAVAAELPGDTDNMKELETIATALGLAASATAGEIVASIGTLKAAQTALTATASALGLADGTGAEEVATAAATLKSRADAGGADITKFVPIEQYKPLVERVARIDEERATAAIDTAIAAGKLAPSTRGYWIGEFKRDEVATASYIKDAPVILTPGKMPLNNADVQTSSDTLTEEEASACEKHGWDPAEYLAQKKQENR